MSEQVQHTQGPWSVGHGSGITGPRAAAIYLSMNGVRYEVIRKDDRLVAVVPHGEGDPLEDARRIVAAVNAVEGIPTEALESGIVRDMAGLLSRILDVQTRTYGYGHALHIEMIGLADAIRTTLAKLRGDTDA